MCARSVAQLCLTFATLWTVTTSLLCPWDFSGRNTGVGCSPSPGDLLDPGIELPSPALQADSFPLSYVGNHTHICAYK